MNSVLCRVTDAALNECVNMNATPGGEAYATAPMAVVQPAANLSEEELHTLFESAISSRLLAMREQMDRISGPLPYHTQQRNYETERLPIIVKQPEKVLLFHNAWQRIIMFGSLGLMLTMLGFDLMGLLVLCMR